jgi:hypothetical protein
LPREGCDSSETSMKERSQEHKVADVNLLSRYRD